MKSLLKYTFGLVVFSAILTACYKDAGNYDYLSEDQISIIEIDTVGIENRNAFAGSLSLGDTIRMSPKIKYAHPENLKYSWILYSYPYSAVEQGNSMVYPAPDTICRTLEIEWEIDKPAGSYASHLLVEDTILGLTASMKMQETYFAVLQAGARSGVYILSEYDGQTDIDFYTSGICLIYSGDQFIPRYYSETLGKGTLPGKPLFIAAGTSYYYAFTEEGAYRLSTSGLELMETFDEMFYSTPNYKPQTFMNINNCEFLVNDGKLHVLYTSKGNDRKFSAPIGGNYKAASYLNDATRTSWGVVTGAINADQIIFDEEALSFRPYFAQAAELSEFGNTAANAIIDAKKLPAKPLALCGGEGGKTYAIIEIENVPYLYRMSFYNVVDNGDFSSNGSVSIIDLSGCKDITNMKYFVANYNGSAFYYATDKTVYSFSPTSGQTTSNLIYECTSGEEITCLDLFYGRKSGGFPTPGVALWIGIWEEAEKNGKLMEFEIDPNNGTPRWYWGSMFGLPHSNPHVVSGFGKIKSIATM